jgi:hypothetical protein
MDPFEAGVNSHWDLRVSTLGSIKTRSLGADVLTLSAMTVLAYAQLEGGVKDLSAFVIRNVNARNMELGEIAPRLLRWRNSDEINHLRATVDFDMIGAPSPFASHLKRRVRIRGIDRRFEFNQMNWASLKKIYDGFGLDTGSIEHSASKIDDLVNSRNEVAHLGVFPRVAASILENQLRENVATVEAVLTDLGVQLLGFFPNRLHMRRTT